MTATDITSKTRLSPLAELVRRKSDETGIPAETLLRSLLHRDRKRHYNSPLGRCWADGGNIPPRFCGRCEANHEWAYEVALKRLDQQANRGR